MAGCDAHAWHRTKVGIRLPPACTQHPRYSFPCPQSLHPSGNTLPSIMLHGCQDQTCTRYRNAACIPPVRNLSHQYHSLTLYSHMEVSWRGHWASAAWQSSETKFGTFEIVPCPKSPSVLPSKPLQVSRGEYKSHIRGLRSANRVPC